MIPGVTDRNRLPRLGKIRLGEKRVSKGGKEYPAALDHFNLTDVPEVEAVYGKTAKEIFPVLLPHDDEEIWFPTARKAYRTSGLFCACGDGETATRVYVPEKDEQGEAFIKSTGLVVEEGEMFELPCPADMCPYTENKMCKPIGRLMIMLPDVPKFGVYEIATSSYNSMVNVLSSSRAIRATAGRLTGIPLALVLKPIQVQPDGEAKTVYALDLEYRGNVYSLASRAKQLHAAGPGISGLLPEAGESVPDDLVPHGGTALDNKLSGKPAPGVPRRKSQAAPAAPAPPVAADNGHDDDPGPSEDDAPSGPALELVPEEEEAGLPQWKGRIRSVEAKSGRTNGKDWTVHSILGDDGERFGTFDQKVADLAAKAVKSEKPVRIVFERTERGNKIEEIHP